MKWIGVVILLLAVNGWGFLLSDRYRFRLRFWSEMEQIASQMETEIRYTHDPPAKIWNRMQRTYVYSFSLSELNEGTVPIAEIQQRLHYSSEQMQPVSRFFSSLGTTDLNGQIDLCRASIENFSRCRLSAENICTGKGRLIRRMCLLLSLALIVLAI